MLEAIGLLGGALTRLFSWYSEYQSKKQDNEHELAMLDKQMELSKLQAEQKQQELITQGDISIDQSYAEALKTALEPSNSGVKWVDGLNAAVRPVMAFWWCLFLYSISKGFILYNAMETHATLVQFASLVVTDFDRTVIGSILGFFFVDRHLRKSSGI